MAVVDYYAAHLRCGTCRTVSPDNTTTGMQHKLVSFGEPRILRVGDTIEDLSQADFESEYITVNPHSDDHPTTVLEDWSCPTCNHLNWATIVFSGNTIVAIEETSLTRTMLEKINYLTYDVDESFERLLGEPMYQNTGIKPNFLSHLKHRLPV